MDNEFPGIELSENEKIILLMMLYEPMFYEEILDKIKTYGITEKELNKILDKFIDTGLIREQDISLS